MKTCPKCGNDKDDSEFDGGNGKAYKYCEGCRAYAREAMQRHHDRRRLGVAVQKGRPRSADILSPVRVLYTIPRAIMPEIEAYVMQRVARFIKEQCPDHRAGDMPFGIEFGADLATPRTTERRLLNTANRSGVTPGTPRPRNEEEQAFYDNLAEKTKAMLDRLSKNVGPIQWVGWDNHFTFWKEHGKPIPYDHTKREQYSRLCQGSSTSNTEES